MDDSSFPTPSVVAVFLSDGPVIAADCPVGYCSTDPRFGNLISSILRPCWGHNHLSYPWWSQCQKLGSSSDILLCLSFSWLQLTSSWLDVLSVSWWLRWCLPSVRVVRSCYGARLVLLGWPKSESLRCSGTRVVTGVFYFLGTKRSHWCWNIIAHTRKSGLCRFERIWHTAQTLALLQIS